jgi:hypothetical protein
MTPGTAIGMNNSDLAFSEDTTRQESAAPTFQQVTRRHRAPYRRRSVITDIETDTRAQEAGQAAVVAAAQGFSVTTEIPRRPRVFERAADANFRALHQFEATVVEILDDEFVARTHDITTPNFADEQVTLPLEDVPPADLDLLKVGAVFYWLIGYETNDEGTRKRTSVLRFRRLPAWTDAAVDRISADAAAMMKLFGAR